MRILKRTARFIMELILTLSIVAFILIYLITKTILNENYIISSMEKGDYYNKIYNEIQSHFENYIQQSGLDEKILKDIITKEQVKEDTKKIITNIYNGFNDKISTDELKTSLRSNIETLIETKSLNQEQKKAIDEFIETICEEYKVTILNSEYEQQIYKIYNKIKKMTDLASKTTAVLMAFSTITIIVLNIKRNYKIGTNTGTAFLASGIILTIINIYINKNVKVNYITILNEPLSIIIRNIINDNLQSIMKYGISLIIIGITSIIISCIIHNLVKYKNIMKKDKQIDND